MVPMAMVAQLSVLTLNNQPPLPWIGLPPLLLLHAHTYHTLSTALSVLCTVRSSGPHSSSTKHYKLIAWGAKTYSITLMLLYLCLPGYCCISTNQYHILSVAAAGCTGMIHTGTRYCLLYVPATSTIPTKC